MKPFEERIHAQVSTGGAFALAVTVIRTLRADGEELSPEERLSRQDDLLQVLTRALNAEAAIADRVTDTAVGFPELLDNAELGAFDHAVQSAPEWWLQRVEHLLLNFARGKLCDACGSYKSHLELLGSHADGALRVLINRIRAERANAQPQSAEDQLEDVIRTAVLKGIERTLNNPPNLPLSTNKIADDVAREVVASRSVK